MVTEIRLNNLVISESLSSHHFLDSEINKGTQRGSVDQILEGEQTDV
jgi:hypothetical protein